MRAFVWAQEADNATIVALREALEAGRGTDGGAETRESSAGSRIFLRGINIVRWNLSEDDCIGSARVCA